MLVLLGKLHCGASSFRRQLSILLTIICSFVVLFWLYSYAKGLQWGFDDWINLKDLSQVSSFDGLVNFIFGGIAGPTGRPVSLLAFLPNYTDWPSNPYGFVYGTLIWHCLNMLLVFLLVNRILKIHNEFASSAMWVALVSAVMWAVMPIHASAILLPVQRMTLVSAFFALVSMNIFVYWRTRCAGKGNYLMTVVSLAGVALALLLSVYAKENGVLVIAYLAVIEVCLLGHLSAPLNKRVWSFVVKAACLFIPLLLLAYLYLKWGSIHASYASSRNFDVSERLATQLVILWEYAKNLILPRATAFGPFHDGHAIFSWQNLVPLGALLAWVAASSAVLAWSKTGSMLGRIGLFSLLFFLSGHLLESTFVPLELYFEHRNYLPALGWAIFLSVALVQALKNAHQKAVVWTVFSVYITYNVFVVQQITSLWGQPLFAAEMWTRAQPNSTRAAQMLAREYSMIGESGKALEVLDRFSLNEVSSRLDVKIQAFTLACSTESWVGLDKRINLMTDSVAALVSPNGIATGLQSMGDAVRRNKCEGISLKRYEIFLSELLDHRKIKINRRVRHYVYYELGLVAESMERLDDFIKYAKLAFLDFPSLSVAQKIALELFKSGHEEESLAWIDEAVGYAPTNISGVAWSRSLTSLRNAIIDIQAMRSQLNIE